MPNNPHLTPLRALLKRKASGLAKDEQAAIVRHAARYGSMRNAVAHPSCFYHEALVGHVVPTKVIARAYANAGTASSFESRNVAAAIAWAERFDAAVIRTRKAAATKVAAKAAA